MVSKRERAAAGRMPPVRTVRLRSEVKPISKAVYGCSLYATVVGTTEVKYATVRQPPKPKYRRTPLAGVQ